MKIPRNLNGLELAKKLEFFGYVITRQSGSHMRLSRKVDNITQHLTIHAHKPLRIGTLRQMLKDVSGQIGIDLHELIEMLVDTI